jgi:uncharacterized membrane protein YgcG
LNKDYNHKFQYLYDWRDNINDIEVRKDGFSICESNPCTRTEVSELININKPRPNPGYAYLQIFQSYIWALIASLIAWFGVIRQKLKDPFQSKVQNELPYFTPPKGLTPWQVQSLINKGDITTNETLAAYIFYLNNKGFVSITPDQENKTIILNKLKDIPTDLAPKQLNTIIEYIISDGVQDGILNSEITQTSLDSNIDDFTLQSNSHLYVRKPILYPLVVVIVFAVIGVILMSILADPFQKLFLIGSSVGVLIGFVFVLVILILYLSLRNYQRLNQEGSDRMQEAVGYKYYLSFIEKEKLDFDNNPQEGAKFYLDNLPYAAQFGILAQFNKFFREKQFISEIQAENTGIVYGAINQAPFYTVSADTGGNYDGGGGGGFSGGGGGW